MEPIDASCMQSHPGEKVRKSGKQNILNKSSQTYWLDSDTKLMIFNLTTILFLFFNKNDFSY